MRIACITLAISYTSLASSLTVSGDAILRDAIFPAGGSIERWPSNKIAALSFTSDDTVLWRTNQARILSAYGLYGTFYANTALLTPGSSYSNVFWSISQMGHEIGSHSVSHTHPNGWNQETADGEITNSLPVIAALTGKPCRSFAYPYGDVLLGTTPYPVYYSASNYVASGARTVRNVSPTNSTSWVYMGGITTNNFWIVGNLDYGTSYDSAPSDDTTLYVWTNSLAMCMTNRGWSVVMMHDVIGDTNNIDGNSTLSTNVVASLCQVATNLMSVSNLWVDTFGNVGAYWRIRDGSRVSVLQTNRSSFSVTMSAINPSLNDAVSVSISLPFKWATSNIAVSKNGTNEPITWLSTNSFRVQMRSSDTVGVSL